MKRTSYTLLACICALLTLGVYAQTKDDKNKKPVKPKVIPIPVYLGHSNIAGGSISKNVFDSLLKQGLTSRDTAGKQFKVSSFAFTYGERVLYEDSIGNPIILTDNLEEFCYGDTLTSFLVNNITGRSKPGDTVYFDRVSLQAVPEGFGAQGKSIKLVLTK